MARPIEANYIEGTICRIDGTTAKYARSGACVACTQRYNQRKAERRAKKPGDDLAKSGKRPKVSPRRLRIALAYNESSITAHERGRHLDNLINARFAHLLGENPAQPTVSGGDIHRASLPVGARTTGAIPYRSDDAERREQNAALRTAMETVLPTLPDIVTITDIVAALPPDVVGPIDEHRLPQVISAVLRTHFGIKPFSAAAGRTRLYVLRDPDDRYGGLTMYALQQLKAESRRDLDTEANVVSLRQQRADQRDAKRVASREQYAKARLSADLPYNERRPLRATQLRRPVMAEKRPSEVLRGTTYRKRSRWASH